MSKSYPSYINANTCKIAIRFNSVVSVALFWAVVLRTEELALKPTPDRSILLTRPVLISEYVHASTNEKQYFDTFMY